MSILQPNEWKILNKVDKAFGEVITRHMTEEEIKKYGPPVEKQNSKFSTGVDSYMKKLNITTEEVIELCKEHGTTWTACKTIGEHLGLSQKQVYNLIQHRKIREMLNHEEVKKSTAESIQTTDTSEKEIKEQTKENESKTRLILSEFKSRTLERIKYKILNDFLFICDGGTKICFARNEIDELIKDLQEFKEIAGDRHVG